MLKKFNKGMKCGLLMILLAFLLMLYCVTMDKPVFDFVPWLNYLGVVIAVVSAMRRKFIGKVEKEDKGYVDKGFELNYYKLSYRRRFIRTLWLILWINLILILLHFLGEPAYIVVPMAVGFAVIEYIQASINYKKWKEEENN